MPPTIAAMRPASGGAPEAMAMPSESGCHQNTTSDAGTSWRNTADARPDRAGLPGVARVRSRFSRPGLGTGYQTDKVRIEIHMVAK